MLLSDEFHSRRSEVDYSFAGEAVHGQTKAGTSPGVCVPKCEQIDHEPSGQDGTLRD